jgi:hypothetical protein
VSEQQRPSTDHDVGDASGGHFGDHDFTDHDWNRAVRGETTTERLDRNWRDLLQELRVVQTGVQLLTGLLLTVPFHSSLLSLVHRQVVVYLVATGLSVLSVGLLVAPVIAHRLVFRRHGRRQLVEMGQRLTVYGLVTFGLAVVGVVELIFDVVLLVEQRGRAA